MAAGTVQFPGKEDGKDAVAQGNAVFFSRIRVKEKIAFRSVIFYDFMCICLGSIINLFRTFPQILYINVGIVT